MKRHAQRARIIRDIHDRLLDRVGPRGWWPARTRDEVVIGAVLTQNVAWKGVVRAIENLRAEGLLRLTALATTEPERIAPLIRPARYFNVKARKLRSIAQYFAPDGRSRIRTLRKKSTEELRRELLAVWGVGPETVDCILVYALDRPSFVIDAYTTRIAVRHGLAPEGIPYEGLREIFTAAVEPNVRTHNEFHALLDWAGHHHCKPRPRCESCPLFEEGLFATRKTWQTATRQAREPSSIGR